MFNPFTEVAEDDSADSILVKQAIGGDRAALEKLVLRRQAWVYNIEEAKNGCTMGMLLCLDRKQRLIFTLGAILGASDTVGAEVLEMTTDNFRQSLARARRDLHSFMNNQCGLVNQNNPCRCPKKTRGFIEAGHVDPHHLLFVPKHVERVRDVAPETVREIEDVVEQQHAAIYRDHPFLQPPDQVGWLRRMLESPDLREALHLN